MPTSYAVTRTINAAPERVWRLLTDGEDYPRWNPSVVSLRGRIVSGEKIELVSTDEYSGLLAGLITRTIPDLNDAFGQFADGLKAAAESNDR